jgi:hypothetical protein
LITFFKIFLFTFSLRKSMMQRQTVSTQSTLNPSTEASSFTRSYEVKRDTLSTKESDTNRDIIPLTKVEIVPSDGTAYPKHVYVNISTQNTNTDLGIPANFQLDFDQPFLKNTEKYYLTIAKATFPTSSIPLFKLHTITDSTTGNNGLLEYSVQMTRSDSKFGYIVNTRPVNTPISNGQYFIYYYQQFLDSINLAYMELFKQLFVDSSTFQGTSAPFLTYDGSSNRFKLITQQGVWAPELLPNEGGATMSMNFKTYSLFNSFPVTQVVNSSGQVFLQQTVESQSGVNQIDGSEAVNPIMVGNMTKLTGGLNNLWVNNVNYAQASIVTYTPPAGVPTFYGSLSAANFNQVPTTILYWQPICPVSLANGTGATIYNAAATYVKYQMVYYPTANSVPFVSLVSGNIANTPTPGAATLFWKPLPTGNPTIWSISATYVTGQNVYRNGPMGGSGTIYTSLANANIGHDPLTDTGNWAVSSAFNSNVRVGEYSTLPNWSDVQSIVIQSGSLPIRYEIFAPPQTDDSALGSSGSGSQVPRPVLTDIDFVETDYGFDRTPVQYIPSGQYRMIDMFSREELKRIDAFLQFKNKDLTFDDLILLPGDYFAIKFLFVRNDAVSLT